MNTPLRIALFQDAFFPNVDGVIEVVDHYARCLKDKAEVTVFAPSVPGRPFDDSALPYPVVRCRSLPVPVIDYDLPIPGLDRQFRKDLSARRFDIVHIHSPFTLGKAGIRFAKKHGIPAVATMHSQFRQDFRRAVRSEKAAMLLTSILIRVFEQCDECWAVNGAMAKLYHTEYGYSKLPYVMPNATDMSYVGNTEDGRRRVDKQFGLQKNEHVLLFVGRLNDLKNVFFLAESLGRLKTMTDLPFRMLFVGSGQDEKELKRRITEHGVEDRTVFCGRITDRDLLASVYERADLLLMPSLYDASSLVQIEAASQETPGLFLKGAITADTVTEGVNGFLSDPDSQRYAEAILHILEDPAELARVSANARRDLALSWDQAVDLAYARYCEILSRN